MACILSIETSTDVCSVALSEDAHCIFEQTDFDGPNHAVKLGVFVDEALSFANSHAIPLDAVAVSSGPGSYTGLRIGVSMAKGVCYGYDVPLIAVPTLELLCVPTLLFDANLPDDALLCSMIDARRMEVYSAVYDRALKPIKEATAEVIDAESYKELFDNHEVYFLGNGSEKCKDIIRHPNAHFIDNQKPLAKWMFPLAEKNLLNGRTEDTAYYEPFYLKPYVAKKADNVIDKLR